MLDRERVYDRIVEVWDKKLLEVPEETSSQSPLPQTRSRAESVALSVAIDFSALLEALDVPPPAPPPDVSAVKNLRPEDLPPPPPPLLMLPRPQSGGSAILHTPSRSKASTTGSVVLSRSNPHGDASANPALAPSPPGQSDGEGNKTTTLAEAVISNANELVPPSTELPCDAYGFSIPRDVLDVWKADEPQRVKSHQRLQAKWKKYLDALGKQQPGSGSSLVLDQIEKDLRGNKLKKLVGLGVPRHLRGIIWFVASGGYTKMRTARPGYYQELQRYIIISSKTTNQIEKDLPRTFPDHHFFQSEVAINGLKRLLVGYSLRNPHLGYTQSMNYIAGILLLIVENEERAFWIFCAIIEDCLQDYFIRSILGAQVDRDLLRILLQKRYPKITTHLDNVCFPLETLSLRWFMCMFSASGLPTDTVLRIWDHFFIERSSNILVETGLAIVKRHERDIMSFTDIFDLKSRIEYLVRCEFDFDNGLLKTLREHRRTNKIDLEASRLAVFKHLSGTEKSKSMPEHTDIFLSKLGFDIAHYDLEKYAAQLQSVLGPDGDIGRVTMGQFDAFFISLTAHLTDDDRFKPENLTPMIERLFKASDLNQKSFLSFTEIIGLLLLFIWHGADRDLIYKLCWDLSYFPKLPPQPTCSRLEFCEFLSSLLTILYGDLGYRDEVYETYSTFSEVTFDKFCDELAKYSLLLSALHRPAWEK